MSTDLGRIAEALERCAAALEKSNRETELHFKRAEAGRLGATKVARSPGGRFVKKVTEIPANTGKLPAKHRQTGESLVPDGFTTSTNPVGLLIGTYVKAWQERYKTKARPEITKCIGVFQRLLKERPATEIAELVQVYCQMEDNWFNTKQHDIGSFASNVTKVALARDKGHERGATGEKHWMEIAKEEGTI